MLQSHEQFMSEALGSAKGKGKLGPPAEKGWVEKWRRDLKIAGVSRPLFLLLVWCLIIIAATIPPLNWDAHSQELGSNQFKSHAGLQTTSKRAAVQVQLCEWSDLILINHDDWTPCRRRFWHNLRNQNDWRNSKRRSKVSKKIINVS